MISGVISLQSHWQDSFKPWAFRGLTEGIVINNSTSEDEGAANVGL